MSPAPVTIFINPPPISNQFVKFDIHRKIPFASPAFRSLKISEITYRKSVRLKKPMALGSVQSGIVAGGGEEGFNPAVSTLEQEEALIDNDGDSFRRTAGGLHVFLNRLSKWVVAVTFGGLLLIRHDALALWAAMGSVLNVRLSVTLKQILKQERPVSGISSGFGTPSSHAQYGMPSSHSQSIFFTLMFAIISVIKWKGLNGATSVASLLIAALGSYFSWLRAFLGYHTKNQVIVGAIVGSVYSVLWFWLWEAIVYKAYNSILLVKILVIVAAACFCVAFFLHVIQHWLHEED